MPTWKGMLRDTTPCGHVASPYKTLNFQPAMAPHNGLNRAQSAMYHLASSDILQVCISIRYSPAMDRHYHFACIQNKFCDLPSHATPIIRAAHQLWVNRRSVTRRTPWSLGFNATPTPEVPAAFAVLTKNSPPLVMRARSVLLVWKVKGLLE